MRIVDWADLSKLNSTYVAHLLLLLGHYTTSCCFFHKYFRRSLSRGCLSHHNFNLLLLLLLLLHMHVLLVLNSTSFDNVVWRCHLMLLLLMGRHLLLLIIALHLRSASESFVTCAWHYWGSHVNFRLGGNLLRREVIIINIFVMIWSNLLLVKGNWSTYQLLLFYLNILLLLDRSWVLLMELFSSSCTIVAHHSHISMAALTHLWHVKVAVGLWGFRMHNRVASFQLGGSTSTMSCWILGYQIITLAVA